MLYKLQLQNLKYFQVDSTVNDVGIVLITRDYHILAANLNVSREVIMMQQK
jgi:hypothetical protein